MAFVAFRNEDRNLMKLVKTFESKDVEMMGFFLLTSVSLVYKLSPIFSLKHVVAIQARMMRRAWLL